MPPPAAPPARVVPWKEPGPALRAARGSVPSAGAKSWRTLRATSAGASELAEDAVGRSVAPTAKVKIVPPPKAPPAEATP